MGFLTHRNLPETLGVMYKKMKILDCSTCSAWSDLSLLSKCLVCHNGYQGLSWTRISSRFPFLIKSYVEPTIQILKIFFIRLHGENTLMIKMLFFGSHFLPFFELICNLFFLWWMVVDGWWMVVDGGGWMVDGGPMADGPSADGPWAIGRWAMGHRPTADGRRPPPPKFQFWYAPISKKCVFPFSEVFF